MSADYDILIAGAGPAGCAAAYDLAQAGRHVLLLDKRTFPRHKACACGLTRKTLKSLRYSVEPIIERVCHEIVLQQAAPGTLVADKTTEVRVRNRNPICAMAVRERFDHYCLQQTLAAGAQGGSVTLRKIEGLTALRQSLQNIELDITTADGAETLIAAALIGADGSNGQTRRLATMVSTQTNEDPTWYSRGFALEATVPYAALPATLPGGDAPHDLVFDFAPLPGGYGWLFPKGDHINLGVGTFAPISSSGAPHDAQRKLLTRALLLDYAMQKVGIGTLDHITGQYLGMGGHAYVPYGRVLLVGDAAGLVDPLTGEGIHSAIVSGQAAAAAILSGKPNLAAAYADRLRPLQQTLAFSSRAAQAFYRTPERGFRVMRHPLIRRLVLKTYADGLPLTGILGRLAAMVA